MYRRTSAQKRIIRSEFPKPRLEKSERLWRKKRRKRVFLVIFTIVFFTLLTFAFAFSTHLSLFAIKKIKISNAGILSSNVLTKFVETKLYDGKLHFINRASIFNTKIELIENELLSNFPRIKDVEVSIALGERHMNIDIEERTPFALWCGTEVKNADLSECFAVDDTGFIFENARSDYPEPLFKIFGDISNDVPVKAHIIEDIFSSILEYVTTFKTDKTIILIYYNFNEVLIKFTDFSIKAPIYLPQNAIANLQSVLSSKNSKLNGIDYIDLRFGDRIFYK